METDKNFGIVSGLSQQDICYTSWLTSWEINIFPKLDRNWYTFGAIFNCNFERNKALNINIYLEF